MNIGMAIGTAVLLAYILVLAVALVLGGKR
jgi:hypothetical protein